MSKKIKLNQFVKNYIVENDLGNLLELAEKESGSTGTDLSDYVFLHSMIREKKPAYVLECGTGKSTWIIADALKKNKEEFGVDGKVISMESEEKWYNQAISILPLKLSSFVDIKLSEIDYYSYSVIYGSIYKDIPNYPYDIVFVDGPNSSIEIEGVRHEIANLDFIKLVCNSHRKMSAVIDYRIRTVIAYSILFPPKKVQFLRLWGLGYVDNVNKFDIILNEDYEKVISTLKHQTNFHYNQPSWIKNI